MKTTTSTAIIPAKSLNVAMVAGPEYTIYFCSSRCPGSWHDSRVLKESTLWTAFEQQGRRLFPEGVIPGDSTYACNKWLIPPFRGDVEGARLKFNEALVKTRCTIKRAYGVLKKRFYALQTGMRVRSMTRATELVQCAVILRNLCILFSDNGNCLITQISTWLTTSWRSTMASDKRTDGSSCCSTSCKCDRLLISIRFGTFEVRRLNRN